MAVTVSYFTRGPGVVLNGAATPITAAQANQVYAQTAVVVFGVAPDVQARFTHAWGLDISAPGFFDPEILISLLSDVTSFPSLTFDRANTNVVTINKAASTGPFTAVVTLRRPHSIGQ